MESYFSKDNQRMITLARPIRGVTRYDEMTLTVDVTEACHRSIFLKSRRPIPIGSAGGLALTLPTNTDQVGLCIVTNFLEQSAHGFGIGAYVSALTTLSRAHWGRFCQLIASEDESSREHPGLVRPQTPCRVLSFERAIAPSTQLLLRSRGIEVADLRGETDLFRMTIGHYTQLLVAEQSPGSLERLKRSLRSFEQEERPSVILLSREPKPCRPLAVDPVFGSYRVLHVPCSREILAQRLIHLLWSESADRSHVPLTPHQTECVEDSLTVGTSASDLQLVSHSGIRNRFASLEGVAPGQTAQFVLAATHKSRLRGFFTRLWRQLRHAARIWVDDQNDRRTVWNGAG